MRPFRDGSPALKSALDSSTALISWQSVLVMHGVQIIKICLEFAPPKPPFPYALYAVLPGFATSPIDDMVEPNHAFCLQHSSCCNCNAQKER